MLLKTAKDHLEDVDMNYCQHFIFAQYVSLRLISVGIACCLHAIHPGIFTNTASHAISKLNKLLTH